MEVAYERKVKEEDIDELGHVNNAVYVKFLEYGRGEWYKQAAGMSFSDMKTLGIGTVVVRLDITFRKEALLGDVLTIYTKPQKLGTKSFVLKQEIYNQHGELLTEAVVTNVMFDPEKRTSIPVINAIARNFT